LRVFPTENEEKKLLQETAQHRWYYNAYLDIFDIDKHMKNVHEALSHNEEIKAKNTETIGKNKEIAIANKKILQENKKNDENKEPIPRIPLEKRLFAPQISWRTMQTELKHYVYQEKLDGNMRYCEFVRSETKNKKYPAPTWIEDSNKNQVDPKTHNRVIRGAVYNFVSNLNSAVSNYFNGNIDSFNMNWKTSKGKHEFVQFTDCRYPPFYRDLQGKYCYRLPEGAAKRRTSITWNELLLIHKKSGISVVQDKQTKAWYACLPVERNWLPPNDHRSENQRNIIRGEAIGLDPGMRKFLTGISTTGELIFYGDKAYKEIIPLLFKISKIEAILRKHRKKENILNDVEVQENCKLKQRLWERVKNLVEDLHWKCITSLVLHYEYIFLGDFKVKDCCKKKEGQKNLAGIVKRVLLQYSFYKFKQRLEYMCEKHGCKLILVHEALTTKTCSSCGSIKEQGKSETYNCSACNTSFDRDENSARNILIKGMTMLTGNY